ncbi:MAG: uracil-DNA glycosylase [Geodermatophilaceae bacterium]|nr:uracil-DNA glycosylase [Geodermatophilaceae bacterium]
MLESPAGPAALGSGMLSADNDDETAKNVWHAYASSGMLRTYGLHWNAVPWYVGDGKKNAGITKAQVERGRHYLVDLLALASSIRVVVALGRPAQRSVAGVVAQLTQHGISLIEAPHPSPIPAASTRGKSLVEVNAAFAKALELVGD